MLLSAADIRYNGGMMTSQTPLNRHRIAALLIAFFAFAMSAYLSRSVFERLPHLEDEVAYLYQARIFARGEVTVEIPQPRTAFWQPFVIDYSETGQRFGKYTPGWPALLAAGVNFGQPWVINALLSLLTVALVFRLGSELFNPDAGLIAALLTAFSPAALLLNASLMGHTAALFWATLFMFAYWRMERGRHALRWGLLAGLALGTLAATRPLTTFSIALPFILWSGGRLLAHLSVSWRSAWQTLKPLLLLSAGTLLIASSIPLFNQAATGNPTKNMYTLIWEYDRVGFGECCGRNTHRLEKGLRHTRFDLSLTAADLFGWQIDPITDDLRDHLRNQADYWPATGLSFLLLPFGVLVGLFASQWSAKERQFRRFGVVFAAWAVIALLWAYLPVHLEHNLDGGSFLGMTQATMDDPGFSWLWVIGSMLWLILPLIPLAFFYQTRPQVPYTWLLMAIVLGIVVVQFTYWIGSQRYSTRYYFEALTAAALLSALPLAWLARRASRNLRYVVYPLLLALCIGTLFHYSLPRIQALEGFNMITREMANEVQERREGKAPVLVLVNGSTSGENRVRWRSYGPLMVVTSPFLDSEIVVARDYGTPGMREEIVAQLPDRQIIEVYAEGNDAYFADEYPPESDSG